MGADKASVNQKFVAYSMTDGKSIFKLRHYCLQHASIHAKAPAGTILDVVTPAFCIAKQFGGGTFVSKFMDHAYDYLELNLRWIQSSEFPD